jgi:uncharacterized membrane protein YcaP (DUF421 family)
MEEKILGEQKKKEDEIIVDGLTVSTQQFQEIQNNKKFKLKKLSENTYKKLEKIFG